MNKAKAAKILEVLKKHYPNAKISLNYSNNFELLVAVMLSAQTTDNAVNKVTPALFRKYSTIKKFANANLKDLERYVKSIGLYKTKAKNIKTTSNIILNKFHGRIPKTMGELLTLPGVGRKTANVVLSHAYNIIEGIAVDTHVRRLAFELGLTKEKDPGKIEQDLMKLFDRKDWPLLTHLLIAHGRKKDKAVDKLLREIKV